MRVTRERIIAAAEALFQEQGFRPTNVGQIARLAGTTVTTFYRHFKSKSELAQILQGHLAVEVLGALRRLEAFREPTRQQIREWFNEYYEMWHRIHQLSVAYWEAAAADSKFAAGTLSSTLALTGQLTEMLKRFPPNVRAQLQLRLALLVIVMDRIAFLVKSERQDPRASAVFNEFADIFYNGLFAFRRLK